MDPLTHALLGAAAAQAVTTRYLPGRAWLIGATAAMLPDLDVLIRSDADTFQQLIYHRHFSHALPLVPLGGLIAALPFVFLPRFQGCRKAVVAAAMIGYATHPFLDACTTYGTVLLWPLSEHRFAVDAIAIVDPLFTLALLVGVFWAALARQARPAAVALTLCALYLGLGFAQHQRGVAAQRELAAARGHAAQEGKVMPTLGNLLVWRSVYACGDTLYADALRLPLWGEAQVRQGEAVARFDAEALPYRGAGAERLAGYVRGFEWFAHGFVAAVPGRPRVLGDMRYSVDPATFQPLWGVVLRDERLEYPVWYVHFVTPGDFGAPRLWREVLGKRDDLVRLSELPHAGLRHAEAEISDF